MLSLQSARIETGSPDEEGCLVFGDGKLLAVLVRLSAQQGDLFGRWYVEKGFGRLDGPAHPTFPDLEAAQSWISARASRGI
jgi:hypothetical protein